MKNTINNFDISERSRMSLFIDRGGDFNSFTNGMGSLAEQLGAYVPEFVVFIEIYEPSGELILNYPVEQCGEAELEAAMKRQVLRYAALIENVCVLAVAVETRLVESAEWFALEHFRGIEFLVAETLDRAEKSLKNTEENTQKSVLDFIAALDDTESEIENSGVSPQKLPPPKLCERPMEFQIIALPVIMRAKSSRIKSSGDDEERNIGENSPNQVNSSNQPAPMTSDRDKTELSSEGSDNFLSKTVPKTENKKVFSLRKITKVLYSFLSWLLLIVSIRSVRGGVDLPEKQSVSPIADDERVEMTVSVDAGVLACRARFVF